MSGISHIDEMIDYTHTALTKLRQSKEVMGLLLNNPNIDMSSDAVYIAESNNFFDHDYIDDTILREDAFIMIDTDIDDLSSPTIMNLVMYVQVVCSKNYMSLDTSIFKGYKGNRRDNLVRYIDLSLNQSRDFGIGKLQLESVKSAIVPQKFSSKMMVYTIPDFAVDRRLKR